MSRLVWRRCSWVWNSGTFPALELWMGQTCLFSFLPSLPYTTTCLLAWLSSPACSAYHVYACVPFFLACILPAISLPLAFCCPSCFCDTFWHAFLLPLLPPFFYYRDTCHPCMLTVLSHGHGMLQFYGWWFSVNSFLMGDHDMACLYVMSAAFANKNNFFS